jgi:hypothetical protein
LATVIFVPTRSEFEALLRSEVAGNAGDICMIATEAAR